MKYVMFVLTLMVAFRSSVFAQMSTGQSDGMMSGGSGWGMNSGGFYVVIIAVLVVLGFAFMMKQK
jgi:hypothetical protein